MTGSKVHHVAGGMKAMNHVTDILNGLLAFQVFVVMYERCFMLTYTVKGSVCFYNNVVTLSVSPQCVDLEVYMCLIFTAVICPYCRK